MGVLVVSEPLHAQWNFTPVADNSGPYSQPMHVGINNSGDVLAEWLMDSGSNAIEVYGPNGRTVGFGGPQTQTPYFNVAYPSINSSGQVAFLGVPYPVTGLVVYRDTNGAKTPLQTIPGSDTNGFGNGTSINDSGVAAYRMFINDVTTIRRSDGTIIAQEGVNGFDLFVDPAINNSGQVAFRAQRNGVFDMFVGNGTGTPTNITNGATTSISEVAAATPGFNDNGKATFVAELDPSAGGGEALYLADLTTLTPLFDSATSMFSDFGFASINNLNQVAFTATLDAGGAGIYFYSGGGQPQRVIGTGDSLLGGTVQSAIIYNDSLNDLGQIAVNYRLTSGVRGVAVATIPEPSAALAAAALASVFAAARVRRRR